MVNYGNGKIYKIIEQSSGKIIYVGKTTKEYLSQRLVEHKKRTRLHKEHALNKYIINNGGWNNFSLELICLFPCKYKIEMEAKQAEYIREHKPLGNWKIPLRTSEEYRNDNKDEIKEREEKRKQVIITCQCGAVIKKTGQSGHKKTTKHTNYIWQLNHPEYMKQFI